MSVLKNLFGVIPPVVTPLTDDRKIDFEALGGLIRHVIDGGVHGIFIMGSSGEFNAYSREERRAVIEFTVKEVGGRVPVLAGVSDAASELAARNAEDAEAAGADAVVLTLPYYFPIFQQQGALDHFRYVAKRTSLPVVLYNIPQTVKDVVAVNTIVELAQEGTIAGVKESSTNFTYFQDLLIGLKHLPDIHVFQGSEFQVGASVLMGAHGGVLGIANLVPQLCVELYEAAARKDVEQVRVLQERVIAISQVFWAGESTLGSLKAAMFIAGLCGPLTALPLPSVSETSMAKIRKILQTNGVPCRR